MLIHKLFKGAVGSKSTRASHPPCKRKKAVWAGRLGYYPNAAKTWLIVKSPFLSGAQRIFDGTGVQVTVEGKHHLGAALGSHSFTDRYVSEKVELWSRLVDKLSGIARIHPHAAYLV